MFKKILKELTKKEVRLYAIFGVLTSVLNVALFWVLCQIGLVYFVANLITLIIVKLTAYICNKNFVFKSKCNNFSELSKEFGRFVIWRGLTMLLDYFGLIFLVEALGCDKTISKIFVTILVIAINYITGKNRVFKNRQETD
jgi:putative flippase GtrA